MRHFRALMVLAELTDAERIGHLLSVEGFAVHWARSGPLGVALYEQLCPYLVLLHRDVAESSDPDLCRIMRDQSSLPFIIVTGVWSGIGTQSLTAGADAHLGWSFTPDELRAAIRSGHNSRRRDVDIRDARPASGPGALRLPPSSRHPGPRM